MTAQVRSCQSIGDTASGKSTGPDNVPAELFKAGGETHWTGCIEFVWHYGKQVNGQMTG